MSKITPQINVWNGQFGKEYTDRTSLSFEEREEISKKHFGLTRTEINAEFIGDMDRSIRILEVGSNAGNQLICLQHMGFESLYGIELQQYAVELSKSRTHHINIIQGSIFDIPFKEGFFDLAFTSGVLIHVAPSDIEKALREIYRCTRRYIWGFEYFAERYTQVEYRGHAELLWKNNFASLYLDTFSDLRLIKEKQFKYLENENRDSMFLLEKI